MKKLGILIFAVLTLSLLTGCNGDGAPSGMQLVYGTKESGYYFYAPEEWSVSNVGEIKSAYVSRVDTTSISFAEVYVPKINETKKSDEEYFFEDYFNSSLSEFPKTPEVTINGEPSDFGAKENKADRATKYAFNYEYEKHKYGFMQIFIKEGDKFYIMTYSALLEERTDDKTYYDFHSDEFIDVMENFKFVTAENSTSDKEEYTKDSDGYILISDSSLAGFDMFVPETFKKDYASAIVSATHKDGSNVSLTEATSTGVAVSDYWKTRKEELEDLTKSTVTEIEVNKEASLGNSTRAFSYEYKFEYNGETYHVYQVLGVAGPMLMQKGYVFTYTAKEELYTAHIDEIKKAVEKVDFK